MRAINDLVFLKNHLSALLVHFLSISLIRFEDFLTFRSGECSSIRWLRW